MSFLSDYEKRMLKNREENKKVLASLGLDKPFFPTLNAQRKVPTKQGTKRKRNEDQKPRKAQRSSADSLQTREVVQSSEDDWKTKYGRRRSGRLMGKEPSDFQGLSLEEEDEEEEKPKRIPRNRENIFGQIPGIEVGTFWNTRLECSADGVHRPTVAGIHGNALEGCYSLALSGGYEDDVDYGDCFTYTGEGGRDLKGTKSNPKNLRTAPQSKDQTLTRGNMALTKNVEKGRPVRVIRGYKLDSPFSPEEGYRYDGLYTVEKYWQSVGLSGFMVYKFALKRSDNQPPAVWHTSKDEDESVVEEDSEVSEKDNTVSPCKSPSKNNTNPAETSSVAADSGQDNRTDLGDSESIEDGANENGANKKSANSENGANEKSVSLSATQQDDKPNTDMNTSIDENVEVRKDETNQECGGYAAAAGAAGDNEDDDNMNATSEQKGGSNEPANVKATQGDADATDNDELHVTKATPQEDGDKQTSLKVTQGDDDDDDDDADDNDGLHVTETTRQDEDSDKPTSLKSTPGADDNDELHVTETTRREDSDKPTSLKSTQGDENDDGDNDEHHVTNATLQEDSDKQTSLKATQGDENDDGDQNPKSAPKDQNSDEKNAQVEN